MWSFLQHAGYPEPWSGCDCYRRRSYSGLQWLSHSRSFLSGMSLWYVLLIIFAFRFLCAYLKLNISVLLYKLDIFLIEVCSLNYSWMNHVYNPLFLNVTYLFLCIVVVALIASVMLYLVDASKGKPLSKVTDLFIHLWEISDKYVRVIKKLVLSLQLVVIL